MMGQGSGGQKKLFYSFNRDDHVPADHLLRGIDRCLDLAAIWHRSTVTQGVRRLILS